MASRTRWTWVWVNSGKWWWSGRPGVLWFMGSQRVGHNQATELNWTELNYGWRRQWHPTPVLLPRKSYGWRSLVGCSPWGREDTTERLPFHFSLSCIGEGNGNALQCCCLENPRDGGAWWAAVYGVTQSRTRLKWLSSSKVFMVGFLVSMYFPSPKIKKEKYWKLERRVISYHHMSRSCWSLKVKLKSFLLYF